EETIEPLLERVDGVASVQTQGGLQRQININLNPVQLAAYGLAPNDVAQAVQFGSGLLPGGTIETKNKSYNLRVFSEFRSLDQIRNTIVTMRGTETILVKDVAQVEDAYKENASEVRADFGEGVLVFIMKQSDANTVLTSRRIQEALPEIMNRLPQGTKLTKLWDQSDFIMISINNLSSTALYAFILAFIVIYIFLRNIRGSLIMGISIPLSVIVTFAVLYATNLTLNIISMAGLALAIGMLVDNSIVVLENIYRHRELGESKLESAEVGATEVGMAITASTLTTIAVFVPVLFVPNITGQLFKDLVLTITFSLIVSLIVALTVVPVMSANILRLETKKPGKFSSKIKDRITAGFEKLSLNYSRILNWSLSHKKSVLGIVTLLLIISLGLTTVLGGEFLPKSDQGFLNFLIESPSGTPIEGTRLYAYQVEDIIKDVVPEEAMESVAIFYGEREGIGAFGTTSSTVETIIKLKPKEQRSMTQFQIQDSLRTRL
ncbi:MAG: efflux RND transporter permease subunit, partial [Ignavibacteriaceae bacterium]|nr:efflux RND transporter permease subunit [Ignavibacteriaceae bacterium]